MRLYLDTSVFGGYFDKEFALETRNLFDEIFELDHNLVLSEVTLREIEDAPQKIKNILNDIPKKIVNIASMNQEIIELSNKYILKDILSAKYKADALHIATATIHRVDLIVSWNFKHMVNVRRIREYNSVNLSEGYPIIDIRSPKEVYNDQN